MLSPSLLSLSISLALGTEPLPMLPLSDSSRPVGFIHLTCDCCAETFLVPCFDD